MNKRNSGNEFGKEIACDWDFIKIDDVRNVDSGRKMPGCNRGSRLRRASGAIGRRVAAGVSPRQKPTRRGSLQAHRRNESSRKRSERVQYSLWLEKQILPHS
jgi:hypothetical protein